VVPRVSSFLDPVQSLAIGAAMFLAFGHGVMYVLSFATMVTVVATAVALAVLLVMMVGRRVWRLFR